MTELEHRHGVQQVLAELTSALRDPPSPRSALLFGEFAHASELHHPGDPVPLCLVFDTLPAAALADLHVPLRAAWRKARVEPLLIVTGDIACMADSFPIKVLELRDRSQVLLGENPFSQVDVDREHLRLRLEQETRNHLLRMRRQRAFAGPDERQLNQALNLSVPMFEQELLTLLVLRRQQRVSFADLPDTAEQARQAQEALGFEAAHLQELVAFRKQGGCQDPAALFERHLQALEHLVERVDSLAGAGA